MTRVVAAESRNVDLFSTIAQLLPVYVGASVWLVQKVRARWVRVVVIAAGVAAIFAEVLCLGVLYGLTFDTGLGKPVITGFAALAIGLGGVGMIASVVPDYTFPPLRQLVKRRFDSESSAIARQSEEAATV